MHMTHGPVLTLGLHVHACRGPENEHKWQYRLSEADIKEIEAALEFVKAHNLKPDVRPERGPQRYDALHPYSMHVHVHVGPGPLKARHVAVHTPLASAPRPPPTICPVAMAFHRPPLPTSLSIPRRVLSCPVQDLKSPSDFPLPTLGAKLRAIRDEVVLGKGFHLIR